MEHNPPKVRRNTRQRAAVREALSSLRGFVSAQKLHLHLQKTGSTIGLATVYRTLSLLVDDGEADMLPSPDGENLFRACKLGAHHHHLVCRNCGETREILGGIVEDWAKRVAAEHNFTELEHVVDLFGVCNSCSRRSQMISGGRRG